nr:zinc finger MYM-type protein 1-like [Nicotiana tomentosiformis]
MLDLMNQSQSIHTSFDKQSEKEKNESRRRLSGSIDVARFILRLGFPFCGHDESQSSTNRGIFLKLLQWYGDIDRDIGSIILENAPRNEMMCSPSIQKDIVDACVKETITAIIEDLDGDFFGILVDESKDISHKEQMALVLRYVNKEGEVIERFVGIVHVSNTSAMSLKKTICSFLSNHSPSPTQIRGQGYDGASNMQGELNGVKTLILNESPSAYCIHCFAHQFQLTFVALAKKHSDVDDLFCIVTNVLNIVVVSFKRRDLLREHQAEKLDELLKSGEVHTGRGLNQERGLQRPDDTRWGSHYKMLDNLIVLFPLIIHVLEFTACECPNYADRIVTESLMGKIKGFDFAFMLHLMLKVLAMTNELNYALQRMDQDIVNVMGLLALSKQRLQTMRNSEFGSLMEDVSSFCDKHDIIIPKMDARYFPGKSKRRAIDVTYSYHLHVDIFYVVIDLHFQELNRRFDAVSTDLLLGMASLNPVNLFGNFYKNRIMRLVEYYSNEFDSIELRDLSC